MKLDEFAFLNQQLAGMLASGIPLETALRQVCAGMRRQRGRKDLERLQADLAQGIPLEKALDARKLPDLYKQLVKVGAKSNNLPGLLNLLADHYQKSSSLWTRLKGLMIYPALVLLTALGLSILLVSQRERFTGLFVPSVDLATTFGQPYVAPTLAGMDSYSVFDVGSVMPAVVLGALAAMGLLVLVVPSLRKAARWWLPGFKEAHLSRLASSLSLLLKGGVDLGAALGLVRRLESGGRIGRELALWEHELSQGAGKVSDMGKKTRTLPPLFFWLVAGEGEDLAAGLARAAEIYYARAAYKADLLLNSVLPISVVGLGLVIVVQIVSTVKLVTGGGEWALFSWL
jgi:type II secretory pathway component PulF